MDEWKAHFIREIIITTKHTSFHTIHKRLRQRYLVFRKVVVSSIVSGIVGIIFFHRRRASLEWVSPAFFPGEDQDSRCTVENNVKAKRTTNDARTEKKILTTLVKENNRKIETKEYDHKTQSQWRKICSTKLPLMDHIVKQVGQDQQRRILVVGNALP